MTESAGITPRLAALAIPLCAVLTLSLACGGAGSDPVTDGGSDGGSDAGTDGGSDGGPDGGTSYGSYGGGPNQPPARQVDPTNPANPTLDTDCDGISDYDEIHVTHTDPANPDTDGDGIPDGVELGRTVNIEPARCTGFFVPDADPATATNPLDADTDGDGVPTASRTGTTTAGSIRARATRTPRTR